MIDCHTPKVPLLMQIATGRVVAGQVVVEGLALPEGELVTVLTRDTDPTVTLSLDEESELLEAIAEAERGDTLSVEEVLSRLGRPRRP